MGEDHRRVDPADRRDDTVVEVVGGAQRVVPRVEELDVGAEHLRRPTRLVSSGLLDPVEGHAGLFPQSLRLTLLAEGEAEHVHLLAPGGAEGDGATGAPDEVGGMCAHHEDRTAPDRRRCHRQSFPSGSVDTS
nr:hypothetical protein [Plantactinospora sp. BC1]